MRTRECDNPPPSTNGLQCNGPESQRRACTVEDCEGKISVLTE